MQWHNPDGSITTGVVIEDGAGNKITSFAGSSANASGLIYASQVQGGTGTINYYISPNGSDQNDGSAANDAHAWASLYHASVVCNKIISDQGAPVQVNVVMLPGTYTESQQSVFTSYAGYLQPAIYLSSSTGNAADVIVNYTTYSDGGLIWVQSGYVDIFAITFNANVVAEWFVAALEGGWANIYNCVFNSGNYLITNQVINVHDTWSAVYINGCSFSGVAQRLVDARFGGRVSFNGQITFVGNPSYTIAAFDVEGGAFCDLGGATSFVGTFTGVRYLCQLNGVINTYGAGVNFIPGSLPGTTAYGGQYV